MTCSIKLKTIASPALTAKTLTAGMSETEPIKNTVDSVRPQRSMDGPPRPKTRAITSDEVSPGSRFSRFLGLIFKKELGTYKD